MIRIISIFLISLFLATSGFTMANASSLQPVQAQQFQQPGPSQQFQQPGPSQQFQQPGPSQQFQQPGPFQPSSDYMLGDAVGNALGTLDGTTQGATDIISGYGFDSAVNYLPPDQLTVCAYYTESYDIFCDTSLPQVIDYINGFYAGYAYGYQSGYTAGYYLDQSLSYLAQVPQTSSGV
jgi:hypothetical protein